MNIDDSKYYDNSREETLRAYVKKARELGKLLYCPYYSLTISPDDLEKAWENGQYRWWNLNNWRMIDKKDAKLSEEQIRQIKLLVDNVTLDYPKDYDYVQKISYLTATYEQVVNHYDAILYEKEDKIKDLEKEIEELRSLVHGKKESN